MKIETVITCVDYSDFLAETLPHNRSLFDRTVVVTAPEDEATRRVCEFWEVECIPTDVFETRWGSFRKGAAINVGLAALKKDGWVLHLDADMVCPPQTRKLLERADLNNGSLYGFDRCICRGDAAWRKFMALPQLQHEDTWLIHLDKFPMGPRIMLSTEACVMSGYGGEYGAPPEDYSGFVPIGYAQLWNPAGSKVESYPEDHSTAARTDVQFALNWPRSRRALIPEVVLYHLESDDASRAANWGGRTTARFGAKGDLNPPVAPAKKR